MAVGISLVSLPIEIQIYLKKKHATSIHSQDILYESI